MSLAPKFLENFSSISMTASSAIDALQQIATHGYKEELVEESWLDAVVAREKEFPTGLPTPIPVAIPHTDSKHVKENGVGFFRLITPVYFGEMGSVDGVIQVGAIIPLLITNPEEQVDLLMSVIGAVQDEVFVGLLMAAQSVAEVKSLFTDKGL